MTIDSGLKRYNGLKRLPGVHVTEYVLKDGLYYPVEKGILSMADDKQNDVPVVSPTGTPVIPQALVLILTVLVAIAGVLAVVPGLPPVVTSIATVVLAIGTALGIASPGVRKQGQ